MVNCIFCQIAVGKIPCFKIYEDEIFLAFLDINPWVLGHTLIIPKKHYRWVWDMPDDLVGQYFAVVNKIANHYRKVLKIEFVMGWIYGLEVPHAHIHLFPDSRGKIAFYPKEKLPQPSGEEGEKLVAKLRMI
ncbi:HIT family protein [Candidatus Shapirobacteria bacterium CG09_land_8_20_14_0_10_38_17]|uniref:HIT family protein n=1 Tax=Candidatus Shapirobacteria bacterium CG09_land_8_20_14_0_10_38_17 TaxID=1974884 RepID=A0A2H0WTH3_9BACT|nr:MAG: HIT family protein [Candidatus Shapirobacteria bacterium CG09_land_8_20_14_0_10_38_17]